MSDSNKTTQSVAWWIISLSISVVCCAILFIVFAGYMVEIKNDLGLSRIRFEVIDQRLNGMSSEIEALRRHLGPQQLQQIYSGSPNFQKPPVMDGNSPQPIVMQPTASPATVTVPVTQPTVTAPTVTAPTVTAPTVTMPSVTAPSVVSPAPAVVPPSPAKP